MNLEVSGYGHSVIEPSPRAPNQRGQIVPLLAGVVTLVAVCALGVAQIGRGAVDRARAQNAADAAALAAAITPDPSNARSLAAHISARNGAVLVDEHRVGGITIVRVRLSDHEASAAATPVADGSPDIP